MLLNYHECLSNSIGTQRDFFLSLVENMMKIRKNLLVNLSKCKQFNSGAIITSTAYAGFEKFRVLEL